MSRIICALLFLASLCGASAQSFYSAVITTTNFAVTGNAVTNNGVYIYFTNVQSATTILTNLAGPNQTSTNIWAQFSLHRPFPGQQVAPRTNADTVTLRSGSPILIGILGNWGYVTYYTNSGTNGYDARLPFSVLPLTVQTQQATDIVTGLVNSATLAPTNSQWLGNFVSVGIPFGGGIQQITAPKNFHSVSGTNAGLTNGLIIGTRGTNLVGLHGDVYALSNGLYATPILQSPTLTNGVNYGNAFSSPGSGTDSEQFGSGALATNTSALAVGDGATAGGSASTAIGANALALASGGSTAVGNGAQATNEQSVALGPSARAYGTNSIAIGSESLASTNNSIAIGTTATATVGNTIALGTGAAAGHLNSIAVGTSAATTSTNQIVLGSSSHLVSIPGAFSGTGTNNSFRGTNNWRGDIAFERADITTTVTVATNRVLLGTNAVYRITGTPGAAWTLAGIEGGNRNGKTVWVYFNTGFNVTIGHQAGTETIDENRIISLTGADQTSTGDGAAMLWYDSGQSRWVMLFFSP
jgi:hypothetical protein